MWYSDSVSEALAEPAWQTFNFWIPLYLANERHMNLKEIAIFAWLPFLAADLGGIFGGYLSPLLMKYFNVKLIPSRIAGIVLGAILMIGPGCIGLAASPYLAIALFCIGGFAHQMNSALPNTLSADVFDPHEVATANGLTGTAAWTGGLSFSLVVGPLARITLKSSQNQLIHLFTLEQDIIRVLVLPDGKLRFARSWAIAPGLEDVPLAGRDRFDLEHFTLPAFELVENA